MLKTRVSQTPLAFWRRGARSKENSREQGARCKGQEDTNCQNYPLTPNLSPLTSKESFLPLVPYLLLLTVFCFHLSTLCAKPVTYLWDLSELAILSGKPASQEYKAIVGKANAVIKEQPVAVTDKTNCISGNKHNYESLSPYWWPDPKNPGGPYIARDGEFNPEFKQYDAPRLGKLKNNLTSCSQAFFLTGDPRYYDFFCRQLDVWFINPDTRMTANFEYCQFIPGRNNGRGNPQGMADTYNFNDMLESIRLVDAVRSIGKERMKALKNWFSDFAYWMQTSEYGKKAQNFKNSQLLSFDTTIYNIFIFTGQKSARKKIFKAFPATRVYTQIEADGKIPEALKRTKAFSYSVSSLQKFVDFVLLTKADGRTLPKECLYKIQSAFDYITPFAKNRKSFPYSEIGNWDEETKKLEKARKRFLGNPQVQMELR